MVFGVPGNVHDGFIGFVVTSWIESRRRNDTRRSSGFERLEPSCRTPIEAGADWRGNQYGYLSCVSIEAELGPQGALVRTDGQGNSLLDRVEAGGW